MKTELLEACLDGALVSERIIKMEIESAYLKIKEELVKKGCKIISEKSPKQIIAKQGSLWGIMPKTAKKILTFNFKEIAGATQVTCESKLGAGWKNLTIIGSVLSVIVVGVCLWIALDLSGFLATRQTSYWSWLISVGSVVNTQIGQALVYLTEILAASLAAIIVADIAIAWYAYHRIGLFASEILDAYR